MTTSRRIGIVLGLTLMVWLVTYYRMCAPIMSDMEGASELSLTAGDTVGSGPIPSGDLDSMIGTDRQGGTMPTDAGYRIGDSNDVGAPMGGGRSPQPGTIHEGQGELTDGPGPTPAAPEPSIPPPPTTYPYAVKGGDTMESIAKEWFGSSEKWVVIAQENPLVDPHKLKAGKVLRLPPKDVSLASVPAQVVARMTKGTKYMVGSGDSLSSISKQFYGKASLWTVIYEANKSKIKNPDAIREGTEILIPPHQEPAD